MSEHYRKIFAELLEEPDVAEAARKSALVVQFHFTTSESFLSLDLKADPFGVTTAPHEAPDVEIQLTPETAERILAGHMSAAEIAKTSSIRAKGGFFKLLALSGFLSVAKDAYARRT